MKWLWEHGCPWDIGTCSCAADGGHLEVLKWSREHDCPWDEENVVRTPLVTGTWRC